MKRVFFHIFNRNMNVPFYWGLNLLEIWMVYRVGFENQITVSSFLFKVKVDWNVLNIEEKIIA